ncbi:MAG: molybdenum cofactor biosynthesis protein MoaE [Nocardioidaceae bacterium]
MTEAIELLAIRDTPLDISQVYAAVQHPQAGGVALFVGTVRDHDSGKSVEALGYSAHPSVEAAMRRVAEEVIDRFPVIKLAAVHRVGDLQVGDLAVVVAVACAHRGSAFDAARHLIDELKATVPIWKHQSFDDGTDEWVGAP